MYLKSLEMQGFKSFPDKTVFNFGKGMTAVVGPNGSGKSNIADAVKWVLGEQSTKSLRGAKMEDVIFSGTDKRKAQGYAEVTLRLDNTDRALSRDDDEVAVTRRFYRSGESEYKINSSSVRLKDVHELFMDTGLGRDGYSMVSQGKIEDMVSAKSQDRREMFEEAAGISHYRYRRADALKRLDSAEENLLRLRDIMTELENRVGPLEKQSEKAQKFLVLSDRRKNLEIGIWLDILSKSSELIRTQYNKTAAAEAQHEKAEKELAEIIEKSEEYTLKSRNITLQIEQVQKNSSSFEEQAVSLEGLIALNKNSIEHNNETINRIEDDKAKENLSAGQIDEQILSAEKTIETLNAHIEEKKNETRSFSDGLDSLSKQNESVSGEYIKISDEMNSLTKRLSDEKVRFSAADSSAKEISLRMDTLKENIKNRESELENAQKEKEQLEEKTAELSEKVTSLTNSVSGRIIRVRTKNQTSGELKLTLDSAVLDSQRIQSRIQLLEDMEKNMEGYSGSVKAVMKESSHGTLRGIHGTMSQIISVKPEYSLAIETALGASIQHIVTDSESDAKRAMNFLKENNIGRATFFPMTSLKARELGETGLENCRGFIDIASKIVTYDKQYYDIIENQLGKTVVVEDIDCAIEMSRKYKNRFKIVTLDGQVINTGGSMTGGAKIKGAGFLTRQSEIETLKKQLNDKNAQVEELEKNYKKSKEELSKENAELESAKAELSLLQEDKIRSDSALNSAKSRYNSLIDNIENLKKEEKSAQERLEALRLASLEAKKREGEITASLDEIQKKLENLNVDREKLSAMREEINSKISEINVVIASDSRDIENQRELIASLESRKNGQSDRLKQLDIEISELKEKNDNLYLRIESLENEILGVRKQKEDANEIVASLVKERDMCDKNVSDLRASEREKNDEKERLASEIVRLDSKKTALEKEQTDTQNKLFEEYKLTRREAEALDINLENIPEAKRELYDVKSKIKSLGNVNVSAIEEYREVSERYEFMKTQLTDVERSKAELIKMIDELTGKMAEQFRDRFNIINACFKETFSAIFGGGSADLILEDENDILECGIEIKAQPPGKNVKNISLLSGGEKGLCAIALLFAILKVTPSPFCIFDEVEAALDDVNVLRYAQYVRSMTDKTQFILITHRRGTMEEADIMYGVTMQEKGVSKILELKTSQMAEELGLE